MILEGRVSVAIQKSITEDGEVNIRAFAETLNSLSESKVLDLDLPTVPHVEFVRSLMAWGSKLVVLTDVHAMMYLNTTYGTKYTVARTARLDPPSPYADACGRLLTEQRVFEQDVVHRDDIEEMCITQLCSTMHRDILLVGERGVGKRSICYAVAAKIAQRSCPPDLWGRRIYELEPDRLLTDHGRDALEMLARDIVAPEDIMMIPDLQIVLGSAFNAPGMSQTTVHIPIPNTPDIPLICTCSKQGYTTFIVGTLIEDRFTVIHVSEPERDMIKEIATRHKKRIELAHGTSIDDETIDRAMRTSSMHMSNVSEPARTLRVLDSASCAALIREVGKPLSREVDEVHTKWVESIEKGDLIGASLLLNGVKAVPGNVPVRDEDIAKALSALTHTEVTIATVENDPMIEAAKRMPEELSSRLVNQSEAITAVCSALHRSLVFKSQRKPLGIMLFLGPPGVGKTYLAQLISEVAFGGKILILDMSEFSERHTVSRLIGAPAGYIGYNEGGELTNFLMNNTHCLVVLDEIEKAHENVYKILLGVMNNGTITDMKGRVVSVNGALFILTSNLGTRYITDRKPTIGFNTNREDPTREVMNEVKEFFSPEFRDRLTCSVIFNELKADDMRMIVGLELEKIHRETEGPPISISDSATSILLEDWKPGDGARYVQRTIASHILDEISRRVIAGELSRSDPITVYESKGKLAFRRGKNEGKELS